MTVFTARCYARYGTLICCRRVSVCLPVTMWCSYAFIIAPNTCRDVTSSLVTALVASRLDYCNAVFQFPH